MAEKQTLDPTTLESVMAVVYQTPTTGSTISLSQARNQVLIINPAGSLLALTVSLPGSPTDGDIVTLGSSQIVTTFTMSNGTIVGPLTTLAVATFAKYIFNSTASKWFRIG